VRARLMYSRFRIRLRSLVRIRLIADL